MNRKIRSTIVLLILFLALTAQAVTAQELPPDKIDETGHYILGEFYTYYYSNPNYKAVFGDPITEAIIEEGTGLMVQYFEYARFEYHPDQPLGHRVKLTPIGSRLYEHGEYMPGLTSDTPNCHQEPNWDYPVCYAFYPQYLKLGGEAQLGVPVSGMEVLKGWVVQFFEYGKLEWHPQNPYESEVVLAPLGYTYFFNHEKDYSQLNPVSTDDLGYREKIAEINIVAFPEKAVIANGEEQVLNIIAKDQNNVPLSKAILHITVKYPDGEVYPINENITTDTLGLAQVIIATSSETLGTVEVIVRVTFNATVQDTTVTSFRLWY
ncbi:MAG: hypothetical protein ACK2T7_11525 [Anaerolineales bacterium]